MRGNVRGSGPQRGPEQAPHAERRAVRARDELQAIVYEVAALAEEQTEEEGSAMQAGGDAEIGFGEGHTATRGAPQAARVL